MIMLILANTNAPITGCISRLVDNKTYNVLLQAFCEQMYDLF